MTSRRLILITSFGDEFFIMDPFDAIFMRKSYRIIGTLVGTIAQTSHQNEKFCMPMQLLREEAIFLLNKGVAEIKKHRIDSVLPSTELSEIYHVWKRTEIDKQSSEIHSQILAKKLRMAPEIARGRAAKLRNNISSANGEPVKKKIRFHPLDFEVTAEQIAEIEKEIKDSPVRTLRDNEILCEIWTESPLLPMDHQYAAAPVPGLRTELERLRYAVFVDLWQKGYCLTAGLKFGGDFLVYPGDPMIYHASYVVVCLPSDKGPSSTDKAAWCRLGSQVKKSFILCVFDKNSIQNSDENILYTVITWQKSPLIV